ncbi:HdeD family acid-resistance protein [Flaviflagellibacter deserti]|uniref:HdeD family acid-resistance protein n=1 Tax=Flaviflagellibacter deserti TaxID=2267266 RepID=A0ABV9Z5Q4_9HYPH
MTSPSAVLDTTRDVEVLRSKWKWLLLAGIALVAVGLIAAINVVSATVASILFIGAMMIAGGIAQLIHAFQVKTWKQSLLWILEGALYIVAGFLAFMNPLLASAAFTLMFALSVIAAGIVRIVAGFQIRPEANWGWLVAAGVLTLLVGALLLAGWPVNSLWIIGFLLAFDLIFHGVALVMFSLALRKIGRTVVT